MTDWTATRAEGEKIMAAFAPAHGAALSPWTQYHHGPGA